MITHRPTDVKIPRYDHTICRIHSTQQKENIGPSSKHCCRKKNNDCRTKNATAQQTHVNGVQTECDHDNSHKFTDLKHRTPTPPHRNTQLHQFSNERRHEKENKRIFPHITPIQNTNIGPKNQTHSTQSPFRCYRGSIPG